MTDHGEGRSIFVCDFHPGYEYEVKLEFHWRYDTY